MNHYGTLFFQNRHGSRPDNRLLGEWALSVSVENLEKYTVPSADGLEASNCNVHTR